MRYLKLKNCNDLSSLIEPVLAIHRIIHTQPAVHKSIHATKIWWEVIGLNFTECFNRLYFSSIHFWGSVLGERSCI